MGDEGKMYVSAEVLPVYKSMILHADLIVPNQYEVEYDSLPNSLVYSPANFENMRTNIIVDGSLE